MSDLESLKNFQKKIMKKSFFDYLACAVIDFSSETYEAWTLKKGQEITGESIYFDLASMTKALTLGVYYLKNSQDFSSENIWLLEHCAGLPSYGVLSKNDWQKQIMSYQIKKSSVLYSDYSSLRLMLEIGKDRLFQEVEPYFDEVKFYLDLSNNEKMYCPCTGQRNGKDIKGIVHDPNAYLIGEKTAHAGLFGTIKGVARTLLNLDQNLHLLEQNKRRSEVKKERPYLYGWESVTDIKKTLAGLGASENTFGFLGFTGTCMWIDPDQKKGWVLLTNVTKHYWHERKLLNELRRSTGKMVWKL